ncbi:hypothetical protein LTR94_030366, partial [Friedmanniomyces endolithicus]
MGSVLGFPGIDPMDAVVGARIRRWRDRRGVAFDDLAAAMGTAEDVAGFLAGPAQRLDERLAEQQQRLEKLRDYADNYP